MKITLESTTKTVHLDGVECRVWEGQSEGGVKIHAYISRIAVRKDEPVKAFREFEEELRECKEPSAQVAAIPLRMIL